MPLFNVAIVYKGQNNYIVEAENEEKAEEIAREKYHRGDNGETLGNEYEEIEHIVTVAIFDKKDGWVER